MIQAAITVGTSTLRLQRAQSRLAQVHSFTLNLSQPHPGPTPAARGRRRSPLSGHSARHWQHPRGGCSGSSKADFEAILGSPVRPAQQQMARTDFPLDQGVVTASVCSGQNPQFATTDVRIGTAYSCTSAVITFDTAAHAHTSYTTGSHNAAAPTDRLPVGEESTFSYTSDDAAFLFRQGKVKVAMVCQAGSDGVKATLRKGCPAHRRPPPRERRVTG